MFRITNTLRCLTLANSALPQANSNLQTLRFRRKPRWMPTAKSKLFRVSQRPVVPLEELEETKRITNNYRTHIKSIRRYLNNQHSTSLQQSIDTEQHIREFKEDFARCNKLNDEWNAGLKAVREERYHRELERDVGVARGRIEEKKARDSVKLEQIEEIVRREKKAAAGFVTRENVDEAIERAIANPVDYNYAIDMEGNRIEGRETSLEDNQPREEVSVKQ